MTTGYLWTGQFEEAQSVVQGEGKPQSMELDEKTLNGRWSTNIKNDIEFFIINDAIFSKLCILGDDVEPCFEGASISKPDVSSNFSIVSDTDFNDFKKTLFSMMKELSEALKGGNGMEQKDNAPEVEVTFTEEQNLSEPAVESALENDLPTEAETDFSEDSQVVEEQLESTPEADFAKDEEEKEEEKEDSTEEEEESKEEEDKEKKYSLLEQQYNDLSVQYEQLKLDYEELVSFKNQVEDERKDALINEFYMLSEEDKKDVIENKSKYTLEEIKAKLSVICYDKKVNFNSDNSENFDSSKEQEEEIITYSYDNDDANLPDWVKAVKNNI